MQLDSTSFGNLTIQIIEKGEGTPMIIRKTIIGVRMIFSLACSEHEPRLPGPFGVKSIVGSGTNRF